MIYLNNNTSAQTINIPYLEMSDSPVPTGNIEPQKNIEITANGNYEVVPDDHYRGIAKVGINVFVDESGQYASGYTSGYTDGYASGTTDGYNSGYTEGEEAQKNKLSAVTITENGQYNRPDGYSAITVNVPTGSTINNQNKSLRVDTNGKITITFDSGYTGLGTVDIRTYVSQWQRYEDNEFWYVRELCVESNGVETYNYNGDYLCHCNNDNTLAGVTVQDGHITATGYMPSPVKLGDDHYICIRDYTNPNTHTVEHYSFECWIEQERAGYNKYLYWKCSSIISMLDAYGTGHNKEGLVAY